MQIYKPKGKACLSLGCGLGRFLRGYVERKAKIVVGLDINRNNLKQCKKMMVDLVRGDVENLPFRDEIFDLVDCEAVMEHVPKPTTALKEIARILSRKNGFSFITWHIYRWVTFFNNPTVRHRFLLYVRDLIANRIPAIPEELLRSKLFSDYGTYRNAGFSYPEIEKFYKAVEMKIILLRIYSHVIFVISKKQH